jgi:glucose-6-phosphate 1-dehydrogenase
LSEDLRIKSAVLVIFGASGDLARRKVIPALYSLFLDDNLPENFQIIGFARSAMTGPEFARMLRDEVGRHSRRGRTTDELWQRFTRNIDYITADYDDPQAYRDLLARLAGGWQAQAAKILYLATPPSLVPEVVKQLGAVEPLRERVDFRIVIEKPFGRDQATAEKLNELLTQVFAESQIYRMDHYLGKETVQNIMAFRFANAMWEPLWNRNYLDHVQITVSEKLGVEKRGGYYDQSGALRDMVQNHLLQLLCLVAMEPPISFQADEIRNKKVDVLHAIRPILPSQVDQFAVRGQYGAGDNGSAGVAYRQEPGVSPDSRTETFAAVKFFIDNWRWQDVPFYLRTGKRMPSRVSEISLQFRSAPNHPFLNTAIRPNRLAIQIEPTEGILLRTQAKEPGPGMRLKPVEMHFTYNEVFHTASPDAYEALLIEILRGDPALFMRADQIDAAWAVIKPIQNWWDQTAPTGFPNYAPGQWGPEDADHLISRDGRYWLMPACLEQKQPKETENLKDDA